MKRETCIVMLKMEEITLKNTYFLSHKIKNDHFQPHLYVGQKNKIKAIFFKDLHFKREKENELIIGGFF
jgi:hypothetical protein